METNNHIQKQKTKQKTKELTKKAEEKGLKTRYGKTRLKEACTKIAARQEQELVDNLQDFKYYNKKGLEKGVRTIARELEEYPPNYGTKVFLQKYEEELNQEIINKAKEILERSDELEELIGRSPSARAAASIYLAAVLTDNYMPNEKVVELSSVSEPTLRKTYTIMVDELDLVDELLDAHPYPSRTRWG